jgi:integrase
MLLRLLALSVRRYSLPRPRWQWATRGRMPSNSASAAASRRPARVGRYGHRDATLILIAYHHGLRGSELVALLWEQIDLQQGLLHVLRLKNGVPSTHPLRGPSCSRRRSRPCARWPTRSCPVAAFLFRTRWDNLAKVPGLRARRCSSCTATPTRSCRTTEGAPYSMPRRSRRRSSRSAAPALRHGAGMVGLLGGVARLPGRRAGGGQPSVDDELAHARRGARRRARQSASSSAWSLRHSKLAATLMSPLPL